MKSKPFFFRLSCN